MLCTDTCIINQERAVLSTISTVKRLMACSTHAYCIDPGYASIKNGETQYVQGKLGDVEDSVASGSRWHLYKKYVMVVDAKARLHRYNGQYTHHIVKRQIALILEALHN